MARPTRKAFALWVTAGALFLIGSNIQAGWLYVLGACLVGVTVAGLVGPAVNLRGLRVDRLAPSVGMVGEPMEVSVQVSNPLKRHRALVGGVDEFLGQRVPFFCPEIPARHVLQVRYRLTPERRGIFSNSSLIFASGYPFGVGTAGSRVSLRSSTTVHPRWFPVSNFPLLEMQSTPNEPFHDRRRKGAGLDFFGIREYRPGDSLRHVHWRSTARGGRVLVKEYEEQLASRVNIWIDAAGADDEPDDILEDAIACAASLAIYALETGHPIQLFADSESETSHLFEPGRNAALDWLAGFQGGGRRSLARLSNEFSADIAPRSTNLLFFPINKRNLKAIPEAVTQLQAMSTRVVALAFSRRASSHGGYVDVDEPPSREEIGLLTTLFTNRVVVYRFGGRSLPTCLSQPFSV